MNTIESKLPLPEIYYQSQSKHYWRKANPEKWVCVTVEDARVFLKSEGISPEKPKEDLVSPLEQCMMDAQNTQYVDYAGPLAGYDAGFYPINGSHVLVTESPRLIVPAEGDWPLLRQVIDGMFSHDGHDQRPYLYGWLKTAIESCRNHMWSPSQVLAFAGPVNSAKSLFQRLITEMLGGRSADPWRYMVGRTDFNGDLFRAEHLMIEDKAESRDMRARLHFASNIKQVAVNREQSCHGKHREALSLTPFWRMTVSVNDEPERLLVLPPMDQDIVDKISLFKVACRPMPMATDTPQQQQAFWNALVAELPAFVVFLLKWEIPAELKSARFGVVHFHHPDLMQSLCEVAPENRFLQLVDEKFFNSRKGPDRDKPWEGSALMLESDLTADMNDVARQARPLLAFPTACGTYLGRLAVSRKDRVVKRAIVHGTTQWIIKPPADQN